MLCGSLPLARNQKHLQSIMAETSNFQEQSLWDFWELKDVVEIPSFPIPFYYEFIAAAACSLCGAGQTI